MKEDKILISILIPTYNRREYLEECINSVEGQKGFQKNEIEILIGDNSEGNETKEFMNEFLKFNHKYIIKYIKNKKNMGSTRNINNLLDLSKGVYYIILSDDDKFYDNNSLKLLYDNLIKYKLDVCYGKYKVIDGDGNDIGDFGKHSKIGKNKIYYDSFDEQILGHSIGFGGILYKNIGYRYNYKSKWLGDRQLNLEYLYNSKVFALINEYTLYYRRHDNNDSYTIPWGFELKFLRYIYKYFHLKWFVKLVCLLKVIIRMFHESLLIRLNKLKSIVKRS